MIITLKHFYRIIVETPKFDGSVFVAAKWYEEVEPETLHAVSRCIFPTFGDAVEAVKNNLYIFYENGGSYPGLVVLDKATPTRFRIFENTLEDEELSVYIVKEVTPFVERDGNDE